MVSSIKLFQVVKSFCLCSYIEDISNVIKISIYKKRSNTNIFKKLWLFKWRKSRLFTGQRVYLFGEQTLIYLLILICKLEIILYPRECSWLVPNNELPTLRDREQEQHVKAYQSFHDFELFQLIGPWFTEHLSYQTKNKFTPEIVYWNTFENTYF